MWVEFVVGSRFYSEDFPPHPPIFLPPQKKPTLQIVIQSEELCTKSQFVDMPLLNPIIIVFFFCLFRTILLFLFVLNGTECELSWQRI